MKLMHLLGVLSLAVGSTALSLMSTHSSAAALCPAHSTRLAAVRCAYNPDGASKARPKKTKTKGPKEKVKAAAPTQTIVPEQTFYEGAPSKSELIIPGISVLTVVGIIPFSAALARQAWTQYKITNRRLQVSSGFQGNEVVQATWREIEDVKWLRRFGGVAGDLVFTLRDGAKLEVRSLEEFDRNLAYMMEQLGDEVKEACYYPDGPAQQFLDKVAAGEEPPVVMPAAVSE